MRVLICGSQGWTDAVAIAGYIDGLPSANLIVIHGGAKGADTLAGKCAEHRGIHCAVVRPLWGAYGNAAGHIRNAAMMWLEPDRVAAFNLGTPGTEGTIKRARELGIPVDVFGVVTV